MSRTRSFSALTGLLLAAAALPGVAAEEPSTPSYQEACQAAARRHAPVLLEFSVEW